MTTDFWDSKLNFVCCWLIIWPKVHLSKLHAIVRCWDNSKGWSKTRGKGKWLFSMTKLVHTILVLSARRTQDLLEQFRWDVLSWSCTQPILHVSISLGKTICKILVLRIMWMISCKMANQFQIVQWWQSDNNGLKQILPQVSKIYQNSKGLRRKLSFTCTFQNSLYHLISVKWKNNVL